MKEFLILALVVAATASPVSASLAEAPARSSDKASSLFRDYVAFAQGKIGDNGPFWFLIDTGANRSALDSSVAAELGLAKDETSTTVQGSAGTIQVSSVSLPKLSIGGVTVWEVRPTVQDLSGSLAPEGQKIAGIVGFDVMKDHAVLFDIANGWLRFAATPEKFGSLAGATSVSFELDNKIPRVGAAIDGISVKLRLDTGASIGVSESTFVNIAPGYYETLKLKNPGLKPIGYFTATGTGGVIRIPVLQGKTLNIGGHEIRDPQLIVQPPVGYFANSNAVGFLGSYSLQLFSRFIVDYPGKRLILFPRRPPTIMAHRRCLKR